jgi:hypothetical protein
MSGTSETYTYAPPLAGQKWGMLVRGSDNATIPCDGANRDFNLYLEWLSNGNTAPEGAPTQADFP